MTMRVSDFVIDRIAREGVRHVFMVVGGGGMFLIDALGRRQDVRYICTHHEQSAAIAAEAYPRVTGNLGVALVTTGPAGTNAITGVACAWTDSIPLLVVSGQSKSTFLIDDTGLRQRGFHEANITAIAAPITKYAVCIRDKQMIAYHLDKAIFLAKNGRPGPVWVDIPIDIQGAMIDPAQLTRFDPAKEYPELLAIPPIPEISTVLSWLRQAKRPLILAGHGVTLAKAGKQLLDFAEATGIPIATTKNGFELVHDAHPLLAGRIGNYGQRAANFAVQNADLLLSIGCRMAFTAVGYETQLFAREARKISVDIDPNQLRHCLVKLDLPVQAHAHAFLTELATALPQNQLPDYGTWAAKIRYWRKLFPNVTDEMRNQPQYVNSYYFYEILSEEMRAEDIMIWDQGAAYHSSTVAFKLQFRQKAFSNDGFTPMGYGLPAAIGACFASNRQVVCVHGDGGLQLNVQELQTVRHHNLPLKLFVFNNEGYTSIKHTQQAYFDGFFVGVDPSSGLSCPDTCKIAAGFALPSMRVESNADLRTAIRKALDTPGPMVVDVLLHPLQKIQPAVKSERLPDGRMASKPLEDMWPYLDRELFRREMIVTPVS